MDELAAPHKNWVALVAGVTKPPPGHGALLGKQWEARFCAQALYEAGFVDALELLIMLCVGCAESQLFDRAIHVNENLTEDRGWLQLSSTHTWITDEMAYDINEAAKAARKLVVAKQKAGGEGFETTLHFFELRKFVHPLGASAKLADGLRATQHQYAQHGDFPAPEV